MNLTELKQHLSSADTLRFLRPDGTPVAEHAHVTEVGVITRRFIDCGGTGRTERRINLQLWTADDVHHRLHPQKLLEIIALSETRLGLPDAEVEVEYQADTVGRYGLLFDGRSFWLTAKQTACLAEDACGIPAKKSGYADTAKPASNTCTPGSGCC